MLDRVLATVGRSRGYAAARSEHTPRSGVRWIVVLLCVLGLFASTFTRTALAAPPSQDGSETIGDEALGKNLFTGATRFEGGGPPCLACHSIAGIGALGGGALGPNLTETAWKGPALGGFLDVVISPNMAAQYPIMNSVWNNNSPLTVEEKAHVGAFFQAATVAQRQTSAVLQLTALAIGGTALMMGLAHLIWLRRSRNVRRTMVGRQAR